MASLCVEIASLKVEKTVTVATKRCAHVVIQRPVDIYLVKIAPTVCVAPNAKFKQLALVVAHKQVIAICQSTVMEYTPIVPAMTL